MAFDLYSSHFLKVFRAGAPADRLFHDPSADANNDASPTTNVGLSGCSTLSLGQFISPLFYPSTYSLRAGGAAVPASSAGNVSLTGSGLVFNNTYGAGITAAFISDIVAAENAFEKICTNACTLNMSFGIGAIRANAVATNSFNPVSKVPYSTLISDLESHVTSANEQAAVNALLKRKDPTGGQGFSISVGMAQILGLSSPDKTVDDSITLSNSQPWSAYQNVFNGNDVIGVLEHEISEGALGRIGGLGIAQISFQKNAWGPMDLFRYTAGGNADTTPKDGLATYFSIDGSSMSSLQFHNSWVKNAWDGQDFADWNQVGPDASATDAFGPCGGGIPTAMSATDLAIMQVLGWTPPSELSVEAGANLSQTKISAGHADAINFVLRNNGLGSSLASTAGIYLSTDTKISTADTLIGTFSTPSVTYGQADAESATFTVPTNLGPGTYYIGIIADYKQSLLDANRVNNVSNPIKLTLQTPTYATINDPINVDNTTVWGINDSNEVVGDYYDSKGVEYAFTDVNGKYSTLNVPLAVYGSNAQGVDNKGDIFGWYIGTGAVTHGFVDVGGAFTTIDYLKGTGTIIDGIGATGIVVGDYYDSGGSEHGFTEYKGQYTLLKAPGALGGGNFEAVGIIGSGVLGNVGNSILGNYYINGVEHGLLEIGSSGYRKIDDPLGADGTHVQGTNSYGDIVGTYYDGKNVAHGFVESGRHYTTINDPLALHGTYANGINAAGDVVGGYTNSSGYHGFLTS